MYATSVHHSELVGQAPRTSSATLRGFLSGLAETLGRWQQRSRDRAYLAALDERLLRDIGLDRVDALREAAKPFWRP